MIGKIIFGSIVGLLVGVGTVADFRDHYKVKLGVMLGLTGCLLVYFPLSFILS